MKFSIEKSVRAGFILVCGLLAGIAVEAYLNIRRARDDFAWSRHSREVITQIPNTLLALQDIESGARGYLLTGDESYLSPYRQALSTLPADVACLKDLTADNPLQQERIRELQGEVDRRLASASALIAARQGGSYNTAQVQTEMQRGKQAMDQIRALLGDFDREEEELHTGRRRAFDEAAGRALWTLGALAGVMFLLFVSAYLILERHLVGRRRAEAALRESEDRVRLLLDSTAEAICGVDRNGLCTFANRAALHSLGYTDPARLVGHGIHDLAHHSRADGTPYQAAECRILQVLQKGVPVHCADEVFWRSDATSIPVEYWSYPMRRGDEITGAVVTFLDITERQRAERDSREVNRRLSEEIRQAEMRTGQITLMSEMASMLQSCTSPAEAYQIVGQAAEKLFPRLAGALGVISPSRDVVEVLTNWGDPAMSEEVFSPEDCWALRSGRPYLVDSCLGRPLCKHVQASKCSATFCVPMMALGESLGILFMSHGQSGDGMPLATNSPQQGLVVAFAESVGLALANLQLRETLRIQSIRDPLTSLYNRRYMEEFFEREVKRAARSGRPIGAILFDLDHFKRYNDTFGHDAGDVLLKEAATLFRTLVRGDDVACRYGGEEFLFLMPETSPDITYQRAETLRNAVGHLHVEHHGQSLGNVTISAGVAIYPDHGQTPAAVLRAADQALYRAKQSGRNRVVIAEQVLSG
jgi:diguanylate cyclase (GGDEF)-like protein/PAS domain S-box-containing protein